MPPKKKVESDAEEEEEETREEEEEDEEEEEPKTKKAKKASEDEEDDDEEEEPKAKKSTRPKRAKKSAEPKKSKKKDPNAPKRPQTAYFLYSGEHREEIKKKYPNLKPKELMKKIADTYKELDEKEKDKYKQKYIEEKKKYDEQIKKYKETKGDDDDEDDDEEEQNSKKRKRGKGEKKSKKKDPNAPKRPQTAYFLFAADQREGLKKKNPGAKPTEIAKKLGALWNEAEASTKEKYGKKAQEAKADYEKALKAYQAKAGAKDESGEEEDDE